MKKLNLNSTIRIRLNDYGKYIYYHRYDELRNRLHVKCSDILKPRFPQVDKDGFSYFQVWEFMAIYGKHCGLGFPEFWTDFNFYIDDEDLDDVEESKE